METLARFLASSPTLPLTTIPLAEVPAVWHTALHHDDNVALVPPAESGADAGALSLFLTFDLAVADVSATDVAFLASRLHALAPGDRPCFALLDVGGIHPKVVALLAMRAFAHAQAEDNAQAALTAGALYLALLSLADAPVYSVFHPFFFRAVVNAFRSALTPADPAAAVLTDVVLPGTKRKASGDDTRPASRSRRAKTSSRARAAALAADPAAGVGAPSSPSYAESAHLASIPELLSTTAALLVDVLANFPLVNEYQDALLHLVDVAVLFSQCHASLAVVDFGLRLLSAVASAAFAADAKRAQADAALAAAKAASEAEVAPASPGRAPEDVPDPDAEPEPSALASLDKTPPLTGIDLVSRMWKALVPNLVMSSVASLTLRSTTPPKALQHIRTAALAFVLESTALVEQQSALDARLYALVQHAALGVPDRAAYIDSATKVCGELARAASPDGLGRTFGFVTTLMRNSKVALRFFAASLAAELLTHRLPAAKSVADAAHELTAALYARVGDKSARVRGRALAGLAAILKAHNDGTEATGAAHALFGLTRGDANARVLARALGKLERRQRDTGAGVRKAALVVLCELARAVGNAGVPATAMASVYEAVSRGTLDPSPMVRKQAMNSLTEALTSAHAPAALRKVWATAVLPGVLDPEAAVSSKALALFDTLVIQPLLAYEGGDGANEAQLSDVWMLLAAVPASYTKYIEAGFRVMAASGGGSLDPAIGLGLQRFIRAHASAKVPAGQLACAEAWMLLAEYAQHAQAAGFDASLLSGAWLSAFGPGGEAAHQMLLLRVLVGYAGALTDEAELRSLANSLLAVVGTLDAPEVASLALSALYALEANPAQTSLRGSGWADSLMSQVDAAVASSVQSGDGETLATPLFMLGELATCGVELPARAVTSVQALVARETTGKLRALAFITLGKLCLADEALARECVPAFGRELSTATEAAVRSNVAVVMGDLCVRYTGVVEAYVPQLAQLIRDPVALVRKHALTLLTRLLQEDYIKWRGPLVFRFMAALADATPAVAQFAEYCLTKVLLLRYPLVVANNFVEALFVLNGCTEHGTFNNFEGRPEEAAAFVITGVSGAAAEARWRVYAPLLRSLTDEQKFALTCSLTSDVLAAFVDGELAVPGAQVSAGAGEARAGVLRDTLIILASDEIAISSANGAGVDSASEALAAAKASVLSKVLHKNVLENVVPVAVALKRAVEEARSPLAAEVMAWIRALVAGYPDEIAEMFVADKRLAAEIEYDLRVYEAQQAERDRLAAASVTASTLPAMDDVEKTPVKSGMAAAPQTPSTAAVRTPSVRATPRRTPARSTTTAAPAVTPARVAPALDGSPVLMLMSPETPPVPTRKWKPAPTVAAAAEALNAPTAPKSPRVAEAFVVSSMEEAELV
ncbi:uncharacterized protein AMSG_01811 [Thecamonas trahens ATCC 50062]|uniref:Condensin complex subunit 1 C-terminal domain-containing protein n=1 Tax=Thecamonas trahens ATCC 50062 TaxID=461836 RepID=A0A0L0DVI3_THETB|nr:hypothetical protein AMSG_01811 [Thecamonas trahens ATCC 50062]KNC55548.1 hypothetical protein AMSG_01811 [Thecamonas trahens ATCC 50062]|eukprot:XP_013761322.1 hypothetical protein AMSG_01811 [Thecamonas trahens ATCC 50062]